MKDKFECVLKNQQKIDDIICFCNHGHGTPISPIANAPATVVQQPVPLLVHTTFPGSLEPPEEVLGRNPRLRGDSKKGALAVALAKHSFFGAELMKISSVGGKGPGTRPLPEQGMKDIRKVIFSLCPGYHNDLQKFEEYVWRKCKSALNHACNRLRSCDTL